MTASRCESDLFDAVDAVVVGTAVLPALGPFIADRTGLGTGAFVLMQPTMTGRIDPTFVGIELSTRTPTRSASSPSSRRSCPAGTGSAQARSRTRRRSGHPRS